MRGEISLVRAWGAFLLSAAEAVCVFFVASAKAGLLLVSANIAAGLWASFFHRDSIRMPVLVLVIAGSAFNLYLLWNAHRLRNAPSAAWRKRGLQRQERWRITLVFSLSIATLIFASAEIYLHRMLHHTIF